MQHRLITKAITTAIFSGMALSHAPSSFAINVEYPNDANINLVQVQSLPGYETVCSSASVLPCDVAAGEYQLVVFSNGWMDIESSVISVADTNQPNNNPNSTSALSNVVAFMYSDDFIEIQFDRLPENFYPELRRNGVELETNGVRSSSLIFRGAEVLSGSYELVAVSNMDSTESAPIALSVDTANRLVSVGTTTSQPTNTPATLSNINAFVYGSDFVEIQFDRLPQDSSPELRLNGETVATNGVGSSSLIFRGADVVSGNYDLVTVSSNPNLEVEPITINIDLENRVATITGTDTGTAEAVADTTFEYIYDLAGYKSDQLASVVPELAKIVIDTAIGNSESLDNGEFLVTDARKGDVTTATDKVRYQCSGGGSMVYETGAVQINDISYTNQADVNNYVFDQCLFNVSNSEANGNYSVNGTLNISGGVVSGSRFSQSDADYEWVGFDLLAADSLRYEVDGSVNRTSASGVGNSFDDRMVNLAYYQKSQDNVVLEGISDNQFQMDIAYHPVNLVNTLELSYAGQVQDSRGGNREFDIATQGTMTFTAGLATESLVQTGQAFVQVSDGAFMSLDASGADDRLLPAKSPLVNFSATLSDGTTESGNDTTLGSYTTFFNYCDGLATDVMADCSNEDVAFFLLP